MPRIIVRERTHKTKKKNRKVKTRVYVRAKHATVVIKR